MREIFNFFTVLLNFFNLGARILKLLRKKHSAPQIKQEQKNSVEENFHPQEIASKLTHQTTVVPNSKERVKELTSVFSSTTDKEQEERNKAKQELINLVYFVNNLLGSREDFYRLPEHIRTLPHQEFKAYAQKNK